MHELVGEVDGWPKLSQPKLPYFICPDRICGFAQRKWSPPPAGMCKIKVDGATSKASREGSYSVVCKDHTGYYLGCSAIKCSRVIDPSSVTVCLVVLGKGKG